ncbi:zinc-dependent alcohol dehydrogenase family protein [Streptomyces olivaceus]|uniref:zinc-dependent alcohol dehydrogenase family protein n=1 Tax=Streptomyces olivaceus TaxID=47716 RepID=UPI0004CC2903|nr:zinc-dependent alcohol dehydrogenase family protein [Streptomyces olivaceus]MBZ6102143.1 zinc-dependent alcohol dehydrogenase family protein [Streptomyces olivaceus]
MKAVAIGTYGDPEGLTLVDLPTPSPPEGEILIAVEAVGVAGMDAQIRSGALADYGFEEGFVPGSEVAGTVTAVGKGRDDSWIGRRVWAFTGLGGGYVEQACVPLEQVVPLPPELSPVESVTIGSSGSVAHFALVHAHLARGEAVLIRGAAGSIGVMAVQLATREGASAVAVTTSSTERGDRLRQLGATHVLDRSGAGRADAPAGYCVIFDVVAGDELPVFLDRLNPRGRMVTVGAVGGQPPVDFGRVLMAQFQRSTSFATFSAASVGAADLQAVRRDQFAAVARGELTAVVHEVLPLDQAVLAHQKMDAGEVFGRIVLAP